MKKYLVILAFLVSGCATKTIMVPEQFHVDAELLIRCPDLATIVENANMGDLLTYNQNLMQQYIECAIQTDSLIEIVKPQKKVAE